MRQTFPDFRVARKDARKLSNLRNLQDLPPLPGLDARDGSGLARESLRPRAPGRQIPQQKVAILLLKGLGKGGTWAFHALLVYQGTALLGPSKKGFGFKLASSLSLMFFRSCV